MRPIAALFILAILATSAHAASKAEVTSLISKAQNSGVVSVSKIYAGPTMTTWGFNFLDEKLKMYVVTYDTNRNGVLQSVHVSLKPMATKGQREVQEELSDVKANGVVGYGVKYVGGARAREFQDSSFSKNGKVRGSKNQAYFQREYDLALAKLEARLR